VFGGALPALLVELSDSADYLLAANSVFAIPGQGPLPALQVLYPHAAGLWPWQEGSTVADEPVLGPVLCCRARQHSYGRTVTGLGVAADVAYIDQRVGRGPQVRLALTGSSVGYRLRALAEAPSTWHKRGLRCSVAGSPLGRPHVVVIIRWHGLRSIRR
jgi:hypothetical protein